MTANTDSVAERALKTSVTLSHTAGELLKQAKSQIIAAFLPEEAETELPTA